MAHVELKGLAKAFASVKAVDAMDLSIGDGELVCLLGPSGSGKSTVLRMIGGFERPTSGSISIDGVDITHVPPERRPTAMVFQSHALWSHMSVFGNIAFGLKLRRLPRNDIRRKVEAVLDLVGLAGYGTRLPSQLSGGQQQRVALARALVIRPRILLLDEPLSNLDAKLREEMQIELRQILRSLGATTILVTHDQAEAMALSDRIAVMNAGRIEQVGTPSDVYERPATPFVAGFLGKTNVIALDAGPATIRPEKIGFASNDAADGLPGTVRTRVFQGHHWLYRVDTARGTLIVIRQNTGEAAPAEGAAVRLTWRAEDVTLGPNK